MERAEFDSFADEYYTQHSSNIAVTGEAPEYFAEYKIALLCRIAAPAQRIIDFGSGIGASMPFFRKYFPDSHLTAADASARSMALARQRFPGNETYLEIADDAVPTPDASFDLAFSACVFHHIDHAEHVAWLRELRRVVAPRGQLVIFEHNPFNPLTVHAVNTCPFDANARLVRAATLAASVRAAGWRAIKIRYHLFFPHALAALRPLESTLGWLPLGGQYSLVAG